MASMRHYVGEGLTHWWRILRYNDGCYKFYVQLDGQRLWSSGMLESAVNENG